MLKKDPESDFTKEKSAKTRFCFKNEMKLTIQKANGTKIKHQTNQKKYLGASFHTRYDRKW